MSDNRVDINGVKFSDVPEGWRYATLGEVAEVSAGGSAPQGEQWFGGVRPFVRVQHLDEGNDWVKRWDLITDEAVKSYRLKLFPKGTIVLPKSGASIRLEKRAILTTDAYLVSHLAAIIPHQDTICPDFLFYLLRSKRLAEEKADGYPTLNLSELKLTPVSFPSLPEQRAIAAVLRAIRRATESCERVIAATCQLKESLLQFLFTYGSVPFGQADQVRLKETEIGLIPEHWNSICLGDVLRLLYRYPSYYKIDYVNDGVPEIRGELLKSDGRIETDRRKFRFISPETSGRFRRTQLEEGDIVMSVRGTMGKIGLVPQQLAGANMTANLIRLSPDRTRVFPEFLRLVLLSRRFLHRLNELSPQTTIKTIQAPVLKSIKIILPPMSEQCEISDHFLAVEAKLAAEEAHRDALANLYQSLLHHLMTGKVRVTG